MPVVGGGGSRLEEGHRYFVGLIWEAARCSIGDPKDPAHWSFIGSKGSIPFDSGILGVGECEDTVQTLEPPVGPVPEWQKTFRDSVLGKDLDGVRDALEQATPGSGSS
ncbi:hypothetical protein BH09ACT10_BH09ACT10_16150 [soil metagenome]